MENSIQEMDSSKRSRKWEILLAFGILATIILGIFIYTLIDYTTKLEADVAKRDSLINEIQKGDSLYKRSLQKYSSTIERYVNNCTFTVNGKEISSQDLVRMLNHSNNEKAAMLDSLIKCHEKVNQNYDAYQELRKIYQERADTLLSSGVFLNLAKKHYGLQFKTTKTNSERQFSISSPKLDSALRLYLYYKDRLRKDSLGNWIISEKQMIIRESLVAPDKKKKGKQ